tara:strand:- start:803 stop:1231 length:429 start_codon:yes stop_codon:yes gene_type:complete
MGTRLYPLTKDTRKVEQLIEVLPGTTKFLEVKDNLYKVFEEQNKGRTEDHNGMEYPVDLRYEWHCLFHNSDVERLDEFQTFGWGKFNLNYLDEGDRICGETHDPDMMANLLISSNWCEMRQFYIKPLPIEEIIKLSEGFFWT